MYRRASCIALCLLLAATTIQAAGSREGSVEIGVFGGYSLLDQYEGSGFDFRQLLISDDDLNPDDDFLLGFRIGYFFTPFLSVEGSFQRLSTEAGFDTCVTAPCPGSGATTTTTDVTLDSFRVNVLYNWREGTGIRPFLALGANLDSTDIEGVVDDHGVGLNAGVGVRFLLGSRFQIRVENRYVFSEAASPVDNGQSSLETQVGFSWNVGG